MQALDMFKSSFVITNIIFSWTERLYSKKIMRQAVHKKILVKGLFVCKWKGREKRLFFHSILNCKEMPCTRASHCFQDSLSFFFSLSNPIYYYFVFRCLSHLTLEVLLSGTHFLTLLQMSAWFVCCSCCCSSSQSDSNCESETDKWRHFCHFREIGLNVVNFRETVPTSTMTKP